MRRAIRNVFAKEDYYCFACSPHNPIGLKLAFYETDEGVEFEWNPATYYESYPGVIHGGIQATLLDEIAAWTVYIKAQTSGVTSRLNVKYKKPVSSRQRKIVGRGKIRNIQRGFCYVDTGLYGEEGDLLAEAEAVYFIYLRQKAVEMRWYPENYEDFFTEEPSAGNRG